MAANKEMFWNKLNAIHEEVHNNTIDIAIVKTNLQNHLDHQDKTLNKKLVVFGIITAAIVGLVTTFV